MHDGVGSALGAGTASLQHSLQGELIGSSLAGAIDSNGLVSITFIGAAEVGSLSFLGSGAVRAVLAGTVSLEDLSGIAFVSLAPT